MRDFTEDIPLVEMRHKLSTLHKQVDELQKALVAIQAVVAAMPEQPIPELTLCANKVKRMPQPVYEFLKGHYAWHKTLQAAAGASEVLGTVGTYDFTPPGLLCMTHYGQLEELMSEVASAPGDHVGAGQFHFDGRVLQTSDTSFWCRAIRHIIENTPKGMRKWW